MKNPLDTKMRGFCFHFLKKIFSNLNNHNRTILIEIFAVVVNSSEI